MSSRRSTGPFAEAARITRQTVVDRAWTRTPKVRTGGWDDREAERETPGTGVVRHRGDLYARRRSDGGRAVRCADAPAVRRPDGHGRRCADCGRHQPAARTLMGADGQLMR